ncbi:peptidoglycan-binding domain-containing protein [Streptomyces sp. NPDC051214]|uniref:peptidoglycan-binding domain-containing protein n=1 Tax=Streptomyces sp. NPDC051214 TaxID=3155282 RepID=UPI00343F00FD
MSSTERRPDGGPGDDREDRRCPECGASRAPGTAPACGCTERAADAARDARSADAAAAEDFDPLRIRPYVTLPEPGLAEEPAPEPGPVPAQALPPEAAAPPRSADVGLFARGEGGTLSAPETDDAPPPPPYDAGPAPRRGRAGLYAAVSAVVAVVAVAVLAAVLLSPDKPQREQALPDVPTRPVTGPSESTSKAPRPTTPSAGPSASPSTSPSSSASPKASPSPTPSHSASPKPRSTRPPSRSTARATGSVEPAEPKADRVLRRGDRGAEVAELQERLQQLYLYMDEPDGTYDSQVEDAVARYQYARATHGDGRGVYGEETRAALEAETREP